MAALPVLLGCDMINTCCCCCCCLAVVAGCVWEVWAFFFLDFLCRPGGPKAPKYFFRKRPGIVVNAPGRLFSYFFTFTIVPPRGGVYSHYYGTAWYGFICTAVPSAASVKEVIYFSFCFLLCNIIRTKVVLIVVFSPEVPSSTKRQQSVCRFATCCWA